MIRSPVVAIPFLLTLWPALAMAQETNATFTVRALGLGVGEIHLTGRATARRYSAESRFAATGLAGSLARIRVNQQVTGQRRGTTWLPDRYAEEIDTARRKSSAQLKYTSGVPVLTGGKLGVEDAPVIDPATQGGTVDPLTGLFAVLRDRAPKGLCQLNLMQFDGARRTRVTLTRAEKRADGMTRCHGQFERRAGYSAKDLARQRLFRFHVDFTASPDGLMRATRAETQSTRGKVTLIRN